MKSSDQPSITKPKKGGVQAAATAAFAKTVTYGQAHAVPAKKTVKLVRGSGVSRARKAIEIAAFSGSNVMAHDAVMKCVPGRMLTGIWESTKEDLSSDAILKAIGVSARTAHRIKAEPDKPLDARTTDGIYRLESVRALAQEVLGSEKAANEWLDTEAMGLEFRKPIDLISTSPGAEAVKTLLQRMKYGVYA